MHWTLIPVQHLNAAWVDPSAGANALERLSNTAIQEFVALRRDIHRHPELAFDEHRTSALVAQKLQAWGYAVTTGLGGTGVVGQLRRGN
eukprot:gene856-1117_t